MDVSIIIVSFNTKDLLKSCIESIYESNLVFKFEIIVVDNASIDGSQEMLKENFPNCNIIQNRDNVLFAKANNQGAAIAKGKYLLLLNSDTIVKSNELEKLVDFAECSSNKVACFGPKVLNPDGSIQSRGFALASISERITMVFNLNRLIPSFLAKHILPEGTPDLVEESHKVGWVSGCCMLFKKNVYEKLNGLNENLEFYGEEPEFGYRLMKNGYETWFVSNSSIIHIGGQSTKHESANFLNDLEGKLFRYSQLQKYTVGYKKSIMMSKIVIIGCYIKSFFYTEKNSKKYFSDAIVYEKKVIDYLKNMM